MVTAGLSSVAELEAPALSFSSGRMLCNRNLHGSCSVGIGSDGQFHYTQLMFTTLLKGWPSLMAQLGVGGTKFPLRLSIQHTFPSNCTGRISFGLGAAATEWKVSATRSLSHYGKVTMDVRHSTFSGLFWVVKLHNGRFTLNIPILVCISATESYPLRVFWLSAWTVFLDMISYHALKAGRRHSVDASKKSEPMSKQNQIRIRQQKFRLAADNQLALMLPCVKRHQAHEISRNGLVIISAVYECSNGEKTIATSQLQFWVKDSQLRFPACSLRMLLGIHHAKSPTTRKCKKGKDERWMTPWKWIWRGYQEDSNKEESILLTVRYRIHGSVYEITLSDGEALILPSSIALQLGSADVVQ